MLVATASTAAEETVAECHRRHADVSRRACVRDGVCIVRRGAIFWIESQFEVALADAFGTLADAVSELRASDPADAAKLDDAFDWSRGMAATGTFQPPSALDDEGSLLPPPYISEWIAEALGMHPGEAIALTSALSYFKAQKPCSSAAALRRGFFAESRDAHAALHTTLKTN